MKRLTLCLIALLGVAASQIQAKDLVVYFSAQGHTQAVAEEFARIMRADIMRIEAAIPYAANPYDDIATPRLADDAGIDMPGNARGVEGWLQRHGLTVDETAIDVVLSGSKSPFELYSNGSNVLVNISGNMASNALNVYNPAGTLVLHREDDTQYTFQLPNGSVYLISLLDKQNGKNYSRKISF